MRLPKILEDHQAVLVPPLRPLVVPVVLDVTIEKSKFDDWCWAAVSAGVATAYGNRRLQCEVVDTVHKKSCCPAGNHDYRECNKTSFLEPALRPHLLEIFQEPAHRTPEFVRQEIDDGHPVAVRIDFNDGKTTGHFVVISGYAEQDGEMTLNICEPRTGTEIPDYRFDAFCSNFEGKFAFWEASYTTKGDRRVPRRP